MDSRESEDYIEYVRTNAKTFAEACAMLILVAEKSSVFEYVGGERALVAEFGGFRIYLDHGPGDAIEMSAYTIDKFQ